MLSALLQVELRSAAETISLEGSAVEIDGPIKQQIATRVAGRIFRIWGILRSEVIQFCCAIGVPSERNELDRVKHSTSATAITIQ